MGSLRRKVSVIDILAQPPGTEETEDGERLKRRRAGDASLPELTEEHTLWSELAEVDCGCCILSLRRGGLSLPGLASLQIRLESKSSRGRQARPSVEWLLPILSRVLSAGIDFVVTYDFRSHSPAPLFAQGLANFFEEHREQWAGHSKSAAVLVKDSLFDTASQGPLRGFIQACSLGCPVVVCHGEAAAEEFFRSGPAGPPPPQDTDVTPFVSVVHVQEADNPSNGGVNTPDPSSCIASLAPLRPSAGSPDSYSDAHTFHVLPNGDVRVIQSPPRDVVLRVDSMGKKREEAARGGQRPDGAAGPGVPAEVLSFPAFAVSGNNSTSSAVAALKFECPTEQLQPLVGAHFHLGELVIDAEIESASRESERRHHAGGDFALSVRCKRIPGSCFDGLNMLICKLLSKLKPLVDDIHLQSPHAAQAY
mmetsp:Transcript_43081/g.133325  ORF Transcript_43081/g.133325 Transcript_43081/m.133325 type:complete len:422 (+) Transcript_43081:143-1408(+)